VSLEKSILGGVVRSRSLLYSTEADIAKSMALWPVGRLVDQAKRSVFADKKGTLTALAALLNKTKDLSLRPAQLEAADALLKGRAVQMQTGEGKTFSLALAAAFLALRGSQVHVVTPSKYLADRDERSLSPFYSLLGIRSSSLNEEGVQTRNSYTQQIIYGPMASFAFDYLRDNLSLDAPKQSAHDFLLVDEVDSQLIDQGTTPLVISGEARLQQIGDLVIAAEIIRGLISKNDSGYFSLVDHGRDVDISDEGYEQIESSLIARGIIETRDELYVEPLGWARALKNAVRAELMFLEGRDYLIQGGHVVIIDQVNHRAAHTKKWSQGIHQAIEAKEGLGITPETTVLASTTVQAYASLYRGIAGISGTASLANEPLSHLYGMRAYEIRSQGGQRRVDHPWMWIEDQSSRIKHVVDLAAEKKDRGQPVLVCATSVSEALVYERAFLNSQIEVQLLTAETVEKEVGIVSRAGMNGAITIATPLAGRGTDISIAREAAESGGLCVILTSPQPSRRFDEQVRGRAGRNGAPGETFGFLGPDSDLIKAFGDSGVSVFLKLAGVQFDDCVSHRRVSNCVSAAQEKSERISADTRNGMLRVENVVQRQKRHYLDIRSTLLENVGDRGRVAGLLAWIVLGFIDARFPRDSWKSEGEWKRLSVLLRDKWGLVLGECPVLPASGMSDALKDQFESLLEEIDVRDFCVSFASVLDREWLNHLSQIEVLKMGMGLKSYAGLDPFVEYKIDSERLFSRFLSLTMQQSSSKALLSAIKNK